MRKSTTIILNEEQQKAANAIDGVWIVIASPGSGKTTVLIQRYLNMLAAGIDPKQILNLTFTNSGAQEMSQRAGILGADSVFRTFHSFAIEILKKEKEHLPFKICDTIIPTAMEDYQLLFDLVKIYPAINWRTLQEKIAAWKCANILPDQAIDEGRNNGLEYFYGLAYRDYEIKCREAGWLDFDSLIRETVNLLETNEEVQNRWKRKYISVDEGQDTDITQVGLLQLLFDGNLFCLNDPNQCVFEWRSAAPYSLINWAKTLSKAETLFLGQNFRSTKSLVSFFRENLPVDNGIGSHMLSENEDGENPTITAYQDADQEAEQVLRSISDPINTVIIARTNRQLFVFQRICVSKGLKYKILGKKDFFETNEIKKLLGLAKGSHDPRPANIVLSDLIQQHNLMRLYQHSGKPTESNPIENLHNLVKMSANKGTIDQFLNHLRKLTHARKSVRGVTLSTCHQAKGLEWDDVFVVGAKQGVMPHKDGDFAEEKRIWFVACSRAAKNLYISFYDNPSEFLNNYLDRIVEFESEVA